jgi:sulfur-oxidizing protein SoxZ
MGRARVRMPATAQRGEIIDIRAQVEHPNDSGLRVDHMGRAIARHVVERFTCSFEGAVVFEATLRPAVSTNPLLQFGFRAERSGEFEFTWTDDQGGQALVRQRLEVLPGPAAAPGSPQP